ncbi:hypothetical protein BDR05DRAFT_957945 [Suillus weaverae]|nr:hypothetical protein BDR05DRAFT_957945 [Suillus weaverae]
MSILTISKFADELFLRAIAISMNSLALIRDFEDDLKASVPTIPVLLESVRKIRVILTTCHTLVMRAFIEIHTS